MGREQPDGAAEDGERYGVEGPFLLEADLKEPGGTLEFRLKMSPSGSARPEEVIDALGLRDLLGQGAILARTEVELTP